MSFDRSLQPERVGRNLRALIVEVEESLEKRGLIYRRLDVSDTFESDKFGLPVALM